MRIRWYKIAVFYCIWLFYIVILFFLWCDYLVMSIPYLHFSEWQFKYHLLCGKMKLWWWFENGILLLAIFYYFENVLLIGWVLVLSPVLIKVIARICYHNTIFKGMSLADCQQFADTDFYSKSWSNLPASKESAGKDTNSA